MEKSITFIETLVEKYSQRIEQLKDLQKEIITAIESDDGVELMK